MSTLITSTEQITTRPRRILRWIAGIAGGIVLVIAALFGFMLYRMSYVPADLDLATTRLSNQGVYRVSYEPRRGPIVINQIHAGPSMSKRLMVSRSRTRRSRLTVTCRSTATACRPARR